MKARITIVDDDKEIRSLIKAIFSMEGCEVTEAADDASLRQSLDGPSPDVVLLDFQLPDGNGLSLLPDLKKKWPRAKVIILTGYGTVEAAEGAFKLDDQLYLQCKPFDPGILKTLVEMALARKSVAA